MAEGAKRVREKETGIIKNLMPGAYADPTKFEELKTGLEQPAFVLAPQPESPIVTNALNQGLNVAQTPPLPPPVAAPEIVPAAGPAIQVPPGTMDVGGLPVAEDSSVPGGMPPAPGGLAPAELKTSTTTIPGFKPSKAAMNELAASTKALADAAREGTEIGVAKANEDLAFAQRKKEVAESEAASLQELNERQAAQKAAKRAEVEKKAAEAADYKVNPDRFFAEKGTIGRVGAAFAVALGAYASSQTGQQNYALKIIDDAIERDIMAQREEKETKNQAVLNKRAEFTDLVAVLGDEKLAHDALWLKKHIAITNQWEENIAKLGSREARQRGMETVAAMREKEALQKIQLEKDMQDKVQTSSDVVLKPTKSSNTMTPEDRKFAWDMSQAYANDPETKQGREMRADAAKVARLTKAARAGDAEAGTALKSMWAKYVAGPGILNEGDFKRANLSAGIFESIKSKISKGLFGQLTDEEISAVGRIETLFSNTGNRLLATSARRAMQGAVTYEIPPQYIVVDATERNLAMEPLAPDTQTRATQLGLTRAGEKPKTAVAKK